MEVRNTNVSWAKSNNRVILSSASVHGGLITGSVEVWPARNQYTVRSRTGGGNKITMTLVATQGQDCVFGGSNY